jgi:hypothetical protein
VSNTESGVLAGGKVVNVSEITSKGSSGSNSEWRCWPGKRVDCLSGNTSL